MKTTQTLILALLTLISACDPYSPCFTPSEACEDIEGGQPTKPWLCSADTNVCTQTCAWHSQCAVPEDPEINAVPRCDTTVSQCVLGCRPGFTCPEGTECVENDLQSVQATGFWGRCENTIEIEK